MAKVSNFNLGAFQKAHKGGALANQFYADITLPASLIGSIAASEEAKKKFRFDFKATSLPASELGEIITPFRGQKYKRFGDRVFQDWEITAINDVDGLTRDVMEDWSDKMVGAVEGDSFLEDEDPTQYFGEGDVHQLTRNDKILKSYYMAGIWPKIVGAVSVDWSSENTVQEFPLTFSVMWIESIRTRNRTITRGDES